MWNVRNIWSWIPILTNNFDWDTDFHLQISIHKLKQMARFFGSDDAHVLSRRVSAYYLRKAVYYGEKALECDDYDMKQAWLNLHYEVLRSKHISWWD